MGLEKLDFDFDFVVAPSPSLITVSAVMFREL
jgi:hypothetical protein